MKIASNFRLDLGFLDGRESAGVRDIKSERSRWKLHCATAHFAEWPMQNVEKSDVKEWMTRLGQKEAADIRAEDAKAREGKIYRRKLRKLGAQSRKHCLNLMRMAFDEGCGEFSCNSAARHGRFERPTFGFGGRHSIQLS